MPAAAVIPAPIAYIKVVAVKKLVVGFLVDSLGPADQKAEYLSLSAILLWILEQSRVYNTFTLKKLECLKQACAMNTLAWNNNIGPWFFFVGF